MLSEHPRRSENPHAKRPRALAVGLAVPLALFAASYGLSHAVLEHFSPTWDESGFARWDGAHYLSIATRGYQLAPCLGEPDKPCGNVGWFPGYPLLIAALTRWLTPLHAALAVSFGAGAGGFLLLFALVRERFGEKAAFWTLAAAAFAPASLFWHAVFPYSLFLLLSVGTAYACAHNRWLLAAALAALLAVTYPSGVLILLLVLLSVRDGVRGPTTRRAEGRWGPALGPLAPAVAVALSGLAYGLYNQLRFGDFFLYARFQQKYGWSTGWPWERLAEYVSVDPTGNLFGEIAMFALIGATAIVFWTRSAPRSWKLYGASILLLGPLAGSLMCFYRHALPCWPLYALLGASEASDRLKAVWIMGSVLFAWSYFWPRYAAGLLV